MITSLAKRGENVVARSLAMVTSPAGESPCRGEIRAPGKMISQKINY